MWRADFPLFKNHPELVFLDSAASAQKPASVLQVMEEAHTQYYANVHRGLYRLSQEATTAYEAVRGKVARFMNAQEQEIVFTRNATEAINLVANTWGAQNIQAGDGIILTELEHHANIVPWQMLAERTGANVIVAPIEEDGSLPSENITSLITEKTKLIAFTGLSNALGTMVDVSSVCAAAKEKGVVTLVDASQRIVHGGVDVQAWDADFVVWTGHKLYGPTGVGVLFGKKELLDAMPPYQGGGDMIEKVSFSGTTYAEAPAKFEAGTPNIVGVIALGAAVDYVTAHGGAAAEAYESALFKTLRETLTSIKGVNVITPERQSAVISFTLEGISTHDAAVLLDECGVACRTGHHCAMPLMERLGLTGTIRASIAPYNVNHDIQKFAEAVEKTIKILS